MGIDERKQRDKEHMRRLILDAAKEIFLEKGYYQTSIRYIADKIEYSPGTIYLYFKEKDDIFHELHNEAFGQLLQEMAPLRAVQNPFERLIAMGRIYMEFAFNNKDLYDLMFIMNAPMNMLHDACEWKMGDRVFDNLVQTIVECQHHGRMKEKDPLDLAFVIWSGLHGMCALYCRSRMGVVHEVSKAPADEKALLERSYQLYVDMINRL